MIFTEMTSSVDETKDMRGVNDAMIAEHSQENIQKIVNFSTFGEKRGYFCTSLLKTNLGSTFFEF
jgi:hypothetical protein